MSEWLVEGEGRQPALRPIELEFDTRHPFMIRALFLFGFAVRNMLKLK